MEACYEYFEHTESRKWVTKDWVGKDAFEVNREVETPFSLAGLCLYVRASRHWWNEFRKVAKEDFLEVITHVEEIIYTQKFEGAVVGVFSASIISKDIGLVEKKDLDIGNKGDTPFKWEIIDNEGQSQD
jgi:hypothetical protein